MRPNFNIMIDVETIGKIAGHVVFAIGYCFFDANDIHEQGIIKLDIKESINRGFSIDLETAKWWKSPERITLLRELCKDSESLFSGCSKLMKLLIQAKYHWAWGTDFDFNMIEAYFRYLNMTHYRFGLRDARTLVKCAQQSSLPFVGTVEEKGTLHNPLHDALRQAREVQLAMQKFMIVQDS